MQVLVKVINAFAKIFSAKTSAVTSGFMGGSEWRAREAAC